MIVYGKLFVVVVIWKLLFFVMWNHVDSFYIVYEDGSNDFLLNAVTYLSAKLHDVTFQKAAVVESV